MYEKEHYEKTWCICDIVCIWTECIRQRQAVTRRPMRVPMIQQERQMLQKRMRICPLKSRS